MSPKKGAISKGKLSSNHHFLKKHVGFRGVSLGGIYPPSADEIFFLPGPRCGERKSSWNQQRHGNINKIKPASKES